MAESRHSTAPLRWFSPLRRGIIPLDAFHLPRRLRKRLRAKCLRFTADQAFSDVILGCAAPRPSEHNTWINDEIIAAYTRLHEAGAAHSVEAWHPATGALVGGVYGVRFGAVFCAESKFCRPDLGGTDASKLALAHLLLHLRRQGFMVLDAQFWNPHLAQFGCIEISRDVYLQLLRRAAGPDLPWAEFDPAWNLEVLAGYDVRS